MKNMNMNINLIIGIVLSCIIVLLYYSHYEKFDPKRQMHSERISTMISASKNVPNFSKIKIAYPELDVSEYYNIRKVAKNCRTGCSDEIYNVID